MVKAFGIGKRIVCFQMKKIRSYMILMTTTMMMSCMKICWMIGNIFGDGPRILTWIVDLQMVDGLLIEIWISADLPAMHDKVDNYLSESGYDFGLVVPQLYLA
jgi:hypothetical protein